MLIEPAVPGDAAELFVLQRACWVAEQADNPGVFIPALAESPEDLADWLVRDHVWSPARAGEWSAPSVPGSPTPRRDRSGTSAGYGRPRPRRSRPRAPPAGAAEAAAPAEATASELFTGARSRRNQRMYKKAGYRLAGTVDDGAAVRMVKRR